MTQKLRADAPADARPIAGDPRLFIEALGYDVREDSQQPGLWLWTAPSDGCDISFHSAQEALDDAWSDVVAQTVAISKISDDAWDAMTFEQHRTAVLGALSEDGDEIQDVVDDVLERARVYGFKPDEDMVRGAVEESAGLLNIELSEEEIVDACGRVMEAQEAATERQAG